MSIAAARLVLAGTVATEDYPVELAWSPDATAFVVAGGEGRLCHVVADGGKATLLGLHGPGLLSVAWQPGGSRIATSGQDGSVRLWDAGTTDGAGEIIHRAPQWPAGLAWRADGRRLAFAVAKVLRVVDDEGVAVLDLGPHPAPLSHVAWRGRDELVAVAHNLMFVDRIDQGGRVEQFAMDGTPLTLVLSPDGKLAASGLADGSINFRYLNTRRRSGMSGYEGKVDQTVWSSNSRLLATSSTGASSIVVWDFGGKGPEGSQPQQLEGHTERIDALAWQCKGPHLASAGRDRRLVLWRPGTQQRAPLDVHVLEDMAVLARWSPDGRRLAVALADGRVQVCSIAG